MRRRWLTAALAVAMVVGAGCTTSDDSDAASPTTTEAPAASTTSSSADTTTTTVPPATAEDVVTVLRDAGLPIGEVIVWDAATDPNGLLGRPGQYTGKVTFTDTRLAPAPVGAEAIDVDVGGDIEVFDDPEAQAARVEYLAGFADNPGPIGGWYQYEVGNAVVRISFDLTPDQAAEYESALQALS